MVCRLDDSQDFLSVEVQAPSAAPLERRLAVAEYITRANWKQRLGAFVMDCNDGEIRYRIGVDYEGEGLSTLRVHNTVGPALYVLNRYLPGLYRVMVEGVSPYLAISEIDGIDAIS